MTIELLSCIGIERGSDDPHLLDRFASSAAPLRGAWFAGRAPSSAYAAVVLSIARCRRAQAYLAVERGQVVGRTLVATSPGRTGAATLGLFEVDLARDGHAVADLLIDAGQQWARGSGCTELFAPIDLNTWFTYRFLLPPAGAGAEVAPYEWEPAQPPEYLDLFQRRGFQVAERFNTQGARFTEGGQDLKTLLDHTARAHDAARSAGFVFERLSNLARLEALLDEMHPLCMEAFCENPLFEPLPVELFRQLYLSAAGARDCSLTHVVREPGGSLAGFAFTFIDGDAVIVKTIAVAPSLRGRHLSSALVHAVFAYGAGRGYRHFVSALVRHGNTSDFLGDPARLYGTRVWRHDYVLLRRDLAG